MDLGNWGRTVLRIQIILASSALQLVLNTSAMFGVLVESICAQDVC